MNFLVIAVSGIGLAVGIAHLVAFYRLLPLYIDARRLFNTSLLLYFCGGTLYAYCTLSSHSLEQIYTDRGFQPIDVIFAQLIAIAFAGITEVIFRMMPNAIVIPTKPVEAALSKYVDSWSRFATVTVVVISILIGLYLTGRIGYRGIVHEAGSSQNDPIAVMSIPLIYLLSIICGYRAAIKRQLWTSLAVLAVDAAIAMVIGRRELVMLMAVAVIGLKINSRITLSRRDLIMLAGVTSAAALCAFIFVFATRGVATKEGRQDVVSIATDSFSMLNRGNGAIGDVVDSSKDNVDARVFNLAIYVSELVGADRSYDGAHGAILANDFVMALPYAVFPGKDNYVSDEEYIAYTALHLHIYTDEGNSILSAAYTDFREPGLIIYSLILYMILYLNSFLMKRIRMDVFYLAAVTQLIATVLAPESEFAGWFLLLRSTLIIYVLEASWRTCIDFATKPARYSENV